MAEFFKSNTLSKEKKLDDLSADLNICSRGRLETFLDSLRDRNFRCAQKNAHDKYFQAIVEIHMDLCDSNKTKDWTPSACMEKLQNIQQMLCPRTIQTKIKQNHF